MEEFLDNPRALLEMTLKMGGAQALIGLARTAIPDSEFRQLERQAAGDREKLARLLIDRLVERAGRESIDTNPSPRPAPRAPRETRGKEPADDDRQKGLFDD